MSTSSVNNIRLYGQSNFTDKLNFDCEQHQNALRGKISAKIDKLAHTRLFQDHFKNSQGLKVYVTDHTIKVGDQTIDVNIVQGFDDEKDAILDITRGILRNANKCYAKCISQPPSNHHPANPHVHFASNNNSALNSHHEHGPHSSSHEVDSVRATLNRLQDKAANLNGSNHPRKAEKLAQLEAQIRRLEEKLGIPFSSSTATTSEGKIDVILARLNAIEQQIPSQANLVEASAQRSQLEQRINQLTAENAALKTQAEQRVAQLQGKATPQFSQEQFTQLHKIAQDLSTGAIASSNYFPAASKDAFNALPQELRDSISYQTYLLIDPIQVPQPLLWPVGETLMQNANPALNLPNFVRAHAIHHFILHSLSNEFTSVQGTQPSPELLARVDQLSEKDKYDVMMQLKFLLHRSGAEDTVEAAREAFYGLNGKTATNKQRGEAINRVLLDRIAEYHRVQYGTALKNSQQAYAQLEQHANAKIAELEQNNATLQLGLDAAQKSALHYKTQAEQLHSELQAAQLKIAQLTHDQENSSKEIAQLKALISQKDHDLETANKKLADAKALEGTLLAQINSLNSQFKQTEEALKKSLQEKTQTLEEAKKQIAALQSQITDLTQKLDKQQQQATLEKHAAQTQIDSIKKEIQEKDKHLDTARKTLFDKNALASILQSQIDTLKKQLEDAQAKAQLESIKSQQQLTEAEKHIPALSEENKKLIEALKQAQEDQTKAQIEIATLKGDLGQNNLALNTAQKSLTTANTRIDELQQQIDALKQQLITAEEQRLKDALSIENLNKKLEGTNQARQLERSDLLKDNQQLNQKIAELTQQLQQAKADLEASTKREQDLYAQILALQSQLKGAQNQQQEAQTEVEKLKDDLKQNDLALDTAQKSLTTANNRIDELQQQIHNLTEKNKDFIQDLENAQAQQQLDAARIKDLEKLIAEKIAASEQSQKMLADDGILQQQLQQQIHALKTELEKAIKQQQETAAQVTQLTEENKGLIETLGQTQGKLDASTKREQDLSAQIQSLQAELEEANQQKLDAEEQVTQLIEENKGLTEALEQAQAQQHLDAERIKGLEKAIAEKIAASEQSQKMLADDGILQQQLQQQIHALKTELEKAIKQQQETENQVTQLTEENKGLIETLGQTQGKLDASTQREQDLSAQIQSLQAELEEANQQKLDAEEQVTQLTEENKGLTEALEQAQAQQHLDAERIKGLEKAIAEKIAASEQSQKMLADDGILQQQLQQQIHALKTELEKAIKQQQETAAHVAQLTEENKGLIETLGQTQGKLDASTQREQDLSAQIQSLQAELEEANQQKLDAEEQVTQLTEENKGLTEALEQAQAQQHLDAERIKGLEKAIAEKIAASEQSQKMLADDGILQQQLQQQIHALKTELEKAIKQQQETENQVTQLTEENKGLTEALEQAQAQQQLDAARIKDLEKLIAEKTAASGQSQKMLVEDAARETQLTAQIKALHSKLEEALRTKQTLESEIEGLSKSNQAKDEHITQLEQQLQQAETAAHTAQKKLEQLRSPLETANNELRGAIAALEENKKYIAELEQTIKDQALAIAHLQALQTNREPQTDDLTSLKLQLKQAEEKFAQFQEKIRKPLSEENKELKAANAELIKLQQEWEEKDRHITELTNQLHLAEQTKNSSMQELTQLQGHLNTLNAALHSLQTAWSERDEQIASIKQKSKGRKLIISELNEKLQIASDQNGKLQQRLEQEIQQRNDLIVVYQKLKALQTEEKTSSAPAVQTTPQPRQAPSSKVENNDNSEELGQLRLKISKLERLLTIAEKKKDQLGTEFAAERNQLQLDLENQRQKLGIEIHSLKNKLQTSEDERNKLGNTSELDQSNAILGKQREEKLRLAIAEKEKHIQELTTLNKALAVKYLELESDFETAQEKIQQLQQA